MTVPYGLPDSVPYRLHDCSLQCISVLYRRRGSVPHGLPDYLTLFSDSVPYRTTWHCSAETTWMFLQDQQDFCVAFRSQRRKRATSVTTEAAPPQETPNIIATNRPATTIPDIPRGVSVQLDSDREPCSLRHALVESNNALHAITNTAILFFLIVSFISLFAFFVASTDWGENK